MWGELGDSLIRLWFPFFGAIGAFIIEGYLLVTKPELTHKFDRYKMKMSLGIFTGFVLAYVLQPSDITQAFVIGLGWESVLSSVVKESSFVSAKDERVLRKLKREDLPTIEDNLETALKNMNESGAKNTVPVVDNNGRIMGLVTDGMIKREIEKKGTSASEIFLKEIMIGATGVVKVDENDSVSKAIKIAEKQLVDRRPVKDLVVIDHEGMIKGLLSYDQLGSLDRSLFSR